MQGVRSPLIWFGGKSKYAQHIISKFPAHRVYIEPFGGAAHVISQKPRVAHEVYNDIDGNVVNFLMVAREEPEKLQNECESLPYSRMLYEQWLNEPLPRDPFERAVRFFYMNRSGISQGNANEIARTGWRHSTKSGSNPATGYISACQLFSAFAERMKCVMIENFDFRTLIPKYDGKDVLFYVDPPYIGREKQYALTDKDKESPEKLHRDLAAILNDVKGNVVLSYYADPLLDELYPNWNRDTFQAYKQVVGGDGLGTETEELLLMNFDNRQLTLF
ncbi:DNA adenine methylase [Paenibacillus ottowii]|uniref:DNA adenine methylase n=1 Tax=Paenibacillus ottowii TaxID=2315729 RepID=A0ABY3B7P9_9BACL|nr:DNA adenine methylase [Paenibacillus ottowii]TQS00069.1 DNA adenine methylase [Paenibacillus ottowii]TQS00138.1 DNA adenine methylase [Paenibacillus ottowii]